MALDPNNLFSPETEEQRKARQMRSADQAAKTMFNVFPQGTNFSNIAQNIFGRSPAATAPAGVSTATAPKFPELPKIGPLISTNYGLPPSERQDFRNPAMQWDVRKTATATAPQIPTPTFPSQTSVGSQMVTGAMQPERLSDFGALRQRPIVPSELPKVQMQTPYGSIAATSSQAAAFEARPTAYEGRTPEQQQALLAQIRSRTPASQQGIARQEEYFKQKRAESKALADATTEAFKSGVSPEKIAQARSSYYQSQPNTLAGIRSEFQSMVPEFGTPMEQRTRVAGVRSSFGLPAGGPQPNRPYFTPPLLANNNEDRFGSIFRNLRRGFGGV